MARTGAGNDNNNGSIWLIGARRRKREDRIRVSPLGSPILGILAALSLAPGHPYSYYYPPTYIIDTFIVFIQLPPTYIRPYPDIQVVP